jgi:hypothetical protein
MSVSIKLIPVPKEEREKIENKKIILESGVTITEYPEGYILKQIRTRVGTCFQLFKVEL